MSIMLNTAVFEKEILAGSTQLACLNAINQMGLLNKFSGIELRREFLNEDSVLRDAELKKITSLVQKYGLKLMLSIPQPIFKDGKINKTIFEVIDSVKDYPFSNFKVSCGEPIVFTDDDIKYLQAHCNNQLYRLTLENPPNEFGQVDNVLSELTLFKNHHIEVGYTFDSGNWYWINNDPVEAFKQLVPYLTIFHLKSIVNRDTVLLSNTQNDTWKKLIALVPKNNPIVLEYNIPFSNLEKEVNQLNQELS